MNEKKKSTVKKPDSAPEKVAKKKRKKKQHPVLFGVVLAAFCACIAAACTVFIVGGVVFNYMNESVYGELLTDLDYYKSNQNQTSIVYGYDKGGNTVELCRLHGEENRIWVDYEEMPEELLWSYVCLEDKRFYDHRGVDWIRTIGVMIYGFEQGGSTLTQQLIKNLTKQDEVTFVRKFNEIIRALNLEFYYSKKDIIEAYLNTLYLGAGCYGIKTAAETYYGKEVSELNLAECAMFAGLTKAPYTMSPLVNMEKAKIRQKECLDQMLKQQRITQEEYDEAINYELVFSDGSSKNDEETQTETVQEVQTYYEDYVIDEVIADLQKEYGYDKNEAWRMVYYGGLKIYAAVDIEAQEKLQSIYENRTNFPTARKHSKDGTLPQSSMAVMDYEGRIIAIAGGADKKEGNRSYNRATDVRAKRQPGSTIKPLSVYAPAIDTGVIAGGEALVLDYALEYKGDLWPQNTTGSHGSQQLVTVKYAIAQSLNTVAARIVYLMLGVDSSYRYANEKFHLNLDEYDKDLSPLACGSLTYGTTALEMAQAYACFGNGGRFYESYSYYKVVDKTGKVLLENENNGYEQAIKESTAATMLSLLQNVVNNGTGAGAYVSGFSTFGKTGSSDDYHNRWFCGGTPHYVAAVWFGHDYPERVYSNVSNPAKTIFANVMKELHKGLPSKSFNDVLNEQD